MNTLTDYCGAEYGRHRSVVVDDPPTVEPLTRAQGKLRAGLEWPDGDDRDELMDAMIKAARTAWETQTGMALLPQTRTLSYDAPLPRVLDLIVRPLQSVASVTATLADGTEQILDPSSYVVDLSGSRIAFAQTPANVRAFQPYAITVVAGYEDPDAIPSDIVQAIGVLVGYWATAGRDMVSVGTVGHDMPYGWDDLVGPYRPMVLP